MNDDDIEDENDNQIILSNYIKLLSATLSEWRYEQCLSIDKKQNVALQNIEHFSTECIVQWTRLRIDGEPFIKSVSSKRDFINEWTNLYGSRLSWRFPLTSSDKPFY